MLIKHIPSHFIVDELYDLDALKNTKQEGGSYSYFILKKENLTTQQAIITLAKCMRISSKRIHYCGIKDKVAITTQLISIQHSNEAFAKQLLNSLAHSKDITLTYLGQFNSRLNLSDNLGNAFTITIEDLTSSQITPLSFKKQEFNVTNYVQKQRFGICKNTHLIGLYIIQNNIKKALFEVLKSLPSKYVHEFEEYLTLLNTIYNLEHISLEELSHYYTQLLELLPHFLKEYKTCITHLINTPKDFSGSFRTIPKKIRTLYVHAFQSALLNQLLKENKTHNSLNEKINIDTSVDTGIHTDTLYLIGYDLDENDYEYDKYKKMLHQLDITFEQLKIPHMPELALKKTPKHIFSKVSNYSYELLSDTSVQISFSLTSGAYATQVIDELLELGDIITF